MTSEDLLNTLEDLGDEEFDKFKWFLQQGDILRGRPVIRKSRLETSKRLETVDLMTQTYELPGALEVTKVVLERINRNDLLQSFSVSSPTTEVHINGGKTSKKKGDDEDGGKTSKKKGDDNDGGKTTKKKDDDDNGGKTSKKKADDEDGGKTSKKKGDDEDGGKTSKKKDDDDSDGKTSKEKVDDEDGGKTTQKKGDDGSVGKAKKKKGLFSSKTQAPTSDTDDMVVPVPEPHPITFYQQMLQSNFQDKFLGAEEEWAKDTQHLADIYTELYITARSGAHFHTQHEVRTLEKAWKPAEAEKSIQPTDMFEHPSGESKPIKTVMTNGIAGIGKTFLVQKFVLDWAEKRSNQDVHLIFPFTFRQLNPLKGEKFSLAELIHECIPETVGIPQDALNYIFTDVQSSGITNYDKSKFKLLFVFDGLDESRLHLDLHSEDIRSVDVTKATETDVLLRKLINGKLLRSARIWITTRPAAANQIPQEFINSITEVRGFTEPRKEEFFRKRFKDEEQANRIVSHIKTSRSLLIMCNIPVFCWITATVLEDVLKTREGGELPKTLTELYAEFLVFQIDHTKEKYGPEKSIQYIKSLAKLAFQQLEKGNLIFYEKDLRESGIDFVSARGGVSTQIFKEEQGRKGKDKMFSFVHLSVQDFLAAFYVKMSLINSNKNVMPLPPLSLKNLRLLLSKTSLKKIHRISIDRTLKSPNGSLDLFLRFLLGLSLQTNQEKLQNLLIKTDNNPLANQKTAQYIKKKLSESLSPERSINLFHCLNELNDSSLVEEIQQSLRSRRLSTEKLSLAQWSALVFILLSSEEDLDVFDLKKYSVFASEDAFLRLLPITKEASKVLLSACNLSKRSCSALSSVLSSQPSSLRELDLSNNDLQDSGVKLLSIGLGSPSCRLEKLNLSGCMISGKGCTSLATALRANPYHLSELDLSYNHPGDTATKLLSAGVEHQHWKLKTLRLEHGGEQRMKPGLKKYFCELTLDTNTANRNLKLSDNNRKVTAMSTQQPYAQHAERFDICLQLLCKHGVTGRCYWEVEWKGVVDIAVSYRGIRRRGDGVDCKFGCNRQSWSLMCSDVDRYSVWHNNTGKDISSSSFSSVSNRAGVYVDWPAGTLSFYRICSGSKTLLHTFHTTFTEPLYPGFGFCTLSFGSSVFLSSL
ncbi:NLR family CARD domain-containing protein 3-like [Oreochromis aureus]|uniref:B30.2/SPRY domain-containing protein n=1 Tax=Oreochromis aureus TaxID=47969 RepID=A0AAZ1XFB8_OREAU|nr:NLR family CARD domain-containing protein 3-like [Oreochromis aureus]XP_039469556.1 NLR family CARD domain-containing protein 3-like [Oreochromis aureus]